MGGPGKNENITTIFLGDCENMTQTEASHQSILSTNHAGLCLTCSELEIKTFVCLQAQSEIWSIKALSIHWV